MSSAPPLPTSADAKPAAGQVWDAAAYAKNAGFVPALGGDVLALLAPQPGEEILDIGCGDGVLTTRLVASGATVTGLEPDPSLADQARTRGILVVQQDAHSPFGEDTYDAIFSNAAFHWFADATTVFHHAFRALRPGGRLVVEQGGFGNVNSVLVALNASLEAAGQAQRCGNPWDFPTPNAQRQRMEKAGFAVQDAVLCPRPTPLPTGIRGWLDTFGAPLLGGLAPDQRDAIISDCERRLGGLCDEQGQWFADYVRLRFWARKP